MKKMINKDTLVIAVSARALFDMEESNKIFLENGLEAYIQHQHQNEEKPLKPGTGFPLVRAFLELNNLSEDKAPLVEVIVISNIHPEAGLRVIKSIEHHKLNIVKSAFTGNGNIVPYLSAFNVDLLLSRSEKDAQNAIDAGVPAAMLYETPRGIKKLGEEEQIRIAFDGDAVLFSDESEAIYKEKGLKAFLEHEKNMADNPMLEGPFAKFLYTIQKIQDKAPADKKPFRIALVTARGSEARERVLKTLRAWNVTVDETFFLSGMTKYPILKAFRPHMFFDDQETHLLPSSKHVPSAKVPYKKGSDMSEIMSNVH